jgi:hypothetical protein
MATSPQEIERSRSSLAPDANEPRGEFQRRTSTAMIPDPAEKRQTDRRPDVQTSLVAEFARIQPEPQEFGPPRHPSSCNFRHGHHLKSCDFSDYAPGSL